MRIALFDYGAGNLHSLKKALELGPGAADVQADAAEGHSDTAKARPDAAGAQPGAARVEPCAAGVDVLVTDDWKTALAADALVLPGVGSFGAAVNALRGEEERVRDALEAGLPCLGICLGMQLLFSASDEGAGRGIGFIPGRVRRLRGRIVPQMGWNDVELRPDPLFHTLRDPVAYYANSFVCEVEKPEHVIAWSEYEDERFAAGVRKGACAGVQFHPEKSSDQGLRMIRNFLDSVVARPEEGR